jgi:hypothetical protein
VFALLWAPEKGLSPPVKGAGDFSTGFLGIIAPALTSGLHCWKHKNPGELVVGAELDRQK